MDKEKSLRKKYELDVEKEKGVENSIFDKKGKKKNHVFMSVLILEKDSIKDLLKRYLVLIVRHINYLKIHQVAKKKSL